MATINYIRTERQVARTRPDKSTMPPPQHVLDKIAERKFTGGYKTGRKNLCPTHHIALAANKSCMWCD